MLDEGSSPLQDIDPVLAVRKAGRGTLAGITPPLDRTGTSASVTGQRFLLPVS